MDRLLTQLRLRRAPLRRWLALCVMVFGLQAAAPALAWCLHGGEVAVHAELASFEHAAHRDAMDHCAHHAPDHRMFEARDPGTATTLTGALAMPCIGIVTRLPVIDGDVETVTTPARLRQAAHPPDIPLIQHLSGVTTRLLI